MAHAPPDPNDHIQLGFAQLIEPSLDPVLSTNQLPLKNTAEAVRLWAQFLAPGTSSSVTSVPNVWTDFMTALLVNPASFPWAKQFLSSSAWNFIAEHGQTLSLFHYQKIVLIRKCPHCLV